MGTTIKKSVGKDGVNEFNDTMLVQLLLNNHICFDANLQKWLQPISTRGNIDGKNPYDPTVTAIAIFQREIVGFSKPDGRVDPDGQTLKRLFGPINMPGATGSSSSKPKAPATQTSDPIPLKTNIDKLSFTGYRDVKTHLGTFRVGPGLLFNAVDGERLVTAVIGGDAVFALFSSSAKRRSGVYSQGLTGFVSDVTIGSAAAQIVSSTRVIKEAIILEMHFMAGVAVAFSGAAALASLGWSVGAWIGQNQKHFPKWRKQAAALTAARDMLKRYAPTLYDELFWHLFNKTISNIPSTLFSNDKLAAQTTGEIVGRLGKTGFTGALAVAKSIFSVVWPSIKAVALSLPGAAKKTPKQIEDEIMAAFRLAGRYISLSTAERIRTEIHGRASELTTTFENLKKAFAE